MARLVHLETLSIAYNKFKSFPSGTNSNPTCASHLPHPGLFSHVTQFFFVCALAVLTTKTQTPVENQDLLQKVVPSRSNNPAEQFFFDFRFTFFVPPPRTSQNSNFFVFKKVFYQIFQN